jgi:hypothetical protein
VWGSLATKGSSSHDIDVAVKEETIDIVDLDRADAMMKARGLKCLIVEALVDICRHIATAKG